MKLRELADRLGCRLEGDGEIEIVRVADIVDAGSGDITFLTNPRYASALKATNASAVIMADKTPAPPCAALRSTNPYLAFARAVGILMPGPPVALGVHPSAVVAASATLGADVSIGPFVVIADGARIGDRTVVGPHVTIGYLATVGRDCRLHANVSVRERVVIGDRVVLQDGVVVGSDGFGFAKRDDGTYEKIPQPGVVVIEDDVEVGANSAIDRPAVGETRICAGAKIDNLVQVAHGVRVGRNTLLCAQVGIAGSATVGNNVVLAGQVGVAGHLEIGDNVVATAQTGIPNSVDAGTLVSGYPAIPNRDWLKASAVFRRLPDLKKAVSDLAARVDALDAQSASLHEKPSAEPRE